jgi:quercetin dioxygenase-like cupin family protein
MSAKHSAQVYRWTEMETDFPMERLSRRRIIGKRAMLSHVRLDRGCLVPTHAHENEQFACVLSGRLRFLIGEAGAADAKEIIVGAGEVLHLPSCVPHTAEALEDTVVLDVFSPPSAETGIDRKPLRAD